MTLTKNLTARQTNLLLLWLPIIAATLVTSFIFYGEFKNKKAALNLALHREIDIILRTHDIDRTKLFHRLKMNLYYFEHNNLVQSKLSFELSEEALAHFVSPPNRSLLRDYGPYSYISKASPTAKVIASIPKIDIRFYILKELRMTYLILILGFLFCYLNYRNLVRLRDQNNELIKEGKKLSFAQTTAKLGIWEYCFQTQSFEWSDETFKMLDLPATPGTELNIADFYQMITKENRNKVKEIFQVLKSKGGNFQTEIGLITNQKNKKFLLFTAEAIRDENDTITRIFGTSIDITDKKKLEEEIAIERQKMQDDNQMAAIGELSANISHEISTPMAVIQGHVSLMKAKIKNGDVPPHELIEKCEKIENTIQRVSDIINGMRVLSRKSQYDEFTPTPVKDIFNSILYFVTAKLRTSKVQFEILPYDENLAIMAKPVEISQVILNLVTNAIDAISNLETRWIKIEVTQNAEEVIFNIQDSGIISQEIKDRLFKDSFTTKPIGKGTGIGLTVSKRIVEAHKGKIKLDDSTPNTNFVIKIPKVKE